MSREDFQPLIPPEKIVPELTIRAILVGVILAIIMGSANAILLFDLPFVAIGGRIGGRIREDKIRNRIYEHLPKQFKPEIKVIKDDLMVAKGACLLVEESEGNIIK